MKIETFNYNDIEELVANAYVLSDSNNNCVVIDPGKDYDGLINHIKKLSLNLKAILLTHGHFDHIGGVSRLAKYFNVPVYISSLDIPKLYNPRLNCSSLYIYQVSLDDDIKVIPFKDGDALDILNEVINIVSTPFHTNGSCCFYLKESKSLFTGDTLFNLGIGRSDFPTGSERDIESSLNKLKVLNDDIKIYPGHGLSSTLGFEKKNNPYLTN